MVMAQVSLKAEIKKWGKVGRGLRWKGDEATPLAKLFQAHALEISYSRSTQEGVRVPHLC